MSTPDTGGGAREAPPEDERSADDTDRGWGEDGPADDDERFLRDRPPHWG